MKMLTRLPTLALCCAALLVSAARALTINVYVDAAPNVYGSPDYAPWWTAAQSAAANGTFVNMANGVDSRNVGTTMFNIRDTFVYSFGDLGKRLHFVYWIPNETVADLTAADFQLTVDLVWGGTTYPGWAFGGWVTPHSWTDYAGGVIGTAGVAFWGAEGVNTPEALAADIASTQPWVDAFSFRVQTNNMDPTTLLTVTQRVPDGGAALLLLAAGLGTLLAVALAGRLPSPALRVARARK